LSAAPLKFRCVRSFATRTLLAGVFGLVALLQSPLRAETPTADVVRVEEDWELVLAEPTASGDAPQVTCTTAPAGTSDPLSVKLTFNHRTIPEAGAGGLQLQIWDKQQPLAYRTLPPSGDKTTTGETVRWTQTTEVDAGLLTVEVTGRSNAWRNFAPDDALSVMVGTGLKNLNGYDPASAIGNSDAGAAFDQVAAPVLKRVRLYSASGLITEISTPRDVQPQN
jgi:hypothetical protein